MSAFVKASADALHLVPAVNATIDGDEIVYRDYTDVSIAVATPRGLVVPVLRSVDVMSFAEVEKVSFDLAAPAISDTTVKDEPMLTLFPCKSSLSSPCVDFSLYSSIVN